MQIDGAHWCSLLKTSTKRKRLKPKRFVEVFTILQYTIVYYSKF